MTCQKPYLNSFRSNSAEGDVGLPWILGDAQDIFSDALLELLILGDYPGQLSG